MEAEIQVLDLRTSKEKFDENKIKIQEINLKEIKKETKDFSLKKEDITWIIYELNERNDKVKTTINTALLANYLIKKKIFLFVKTNALNGTMTYLYQDGYYKHVDDIDILAFINKHIPLEIQKSKQSKEVLEMLYQTISYTTENKLNPEKYINFKDCLFNVETWLPEKHNKNIYITIRIDCNCPYNNKNFKILNNSIFDKYLNDLSSNSKDDKEKRSLILQFIGVVLSNISGYRLKKSLFMVGPGDTGKSKIKELICKLLGSQYYSSMDLAILEERFSTSLLYGKRLIGSNDMSFITIKELKTFKKIVGGDDIFAEFKGKNGFDFVFKGIAWFCCNELPKFGGDRGDWVYNRIIILKCENVIPKNKQIKNLVELMLNEKEYIIYLALEELKKVIQNNFEYILPEESTQELENYKIDNNSFLKFIEECTIPRLDNKIKDSCTCKRVYDVYSAWCKDNNHGYKESKKECFELLKKIGKNDKKTISGYTYFSQFTLTLETKTEYNSYYGYDSVSQK